MGTGLDPICTASSALFSDRNHVQRSETLPRGGTLRRLTRDQIGPELPEAANRRYLKFLAAVEDPAPTKQNSTNSRSTQPEGRRVSGFNLFDPDDENLPGSIARGESNISGRGGSAHYKCYVMAFVRVKPG